MQIHIEDAVTQTYIFIVILVLFLIFSFKKLKNEPRFDINITNELKGLAILMIIFAHIGYFLVNDNRFLFPLSVAAGIGVNLFFFLSGYGLSVSAFKKGCSVLSFYKNRVMKLIIPLWLVLMLILFSDYLVLSKIYPFNEVWHSFLGYFPVSDLYKNINSPFWFITPIIFYYLIFPLIFNKKYLYISGILLAIFSYFLLFNNSIYNFLISTNILGGDVWSLYQTHFVAFPLGLIAADLIVNKNIFRNIKFHVLLKNICIFTALIIICYLAIHSGIGENKLKEQSISLISSLLIVFVFVFKDIRIRLLGLFGIYSYEIYLVHWPIMSRYDIFFNYFPPFLAVCFYLTLFLMIGVILQKVSNIIVNKIFL